MTHNLIIETKAEVDYQLLLNLAHRLGLRVQVTNGNQMANSNSQPSVDKAVDSGANSISADALTRQEL